MREKKLQLPDAGCELAGLISAGGSAKLDTLDINAPDTLSRAFVSVDSVKTVQIVCAALANARIVSYDVEYAMRAHTTNMPDLCSDCPHNIPSTLQVATLSRDTDQLHVFIVDLLTIHLPTEVLDTLSRTDDVESNTPHTDDFGGQLLAVALHRVHHDNSVVKLGFSFRQDHRILYHASHSEAFHTLCRFVDIQHLHARIGLYSREEKPEQHAGQVHNKHKVPSTQNGIKCARVKSSKGIDISANTADAREANESVKTKAKADKKISRRLLGLQAVTRDVLGWHLSKEQQCSEWSNRPLSQEQLKYAALDAVILIPLYFELCQRAWDIEDKSGPKPTNRTASAMSLDLTYRPSLPARLSAHVVVQEMRVTKSARTNGTKKSKRVNHGIRPVEHHVRHNGGLLQMLTAKVDVSRLSELQLEDSPYSWSDVYAAANELSMVRLAARMNTDSKQWVDSSGNPKFLCDAQSEGLAKQLRSVGLDAAFIGDSEFFASFVPNKHRRCCEMGFNVLQKQQARTVVPERIDSNSSHSTAAMGGGSVGESAEISSPRCWQACTLTDTHQLLPRESLTTAQPKTSAEHKRNMQENTQPSTPTPAIYTHISDSTTSLSNPEDVELHTTACMNVNGKMERIRNRKNGTYERTPLPIPIVPSKPRIRHSIADKHRMGVYTWRCMLKIASAEGRIILTQHKGAAKACHAAMSYDFPKRAESDNHTSSESDSRSTGSMRQRQGGQQNGSVVYYVRADNKILQRKEVVEAFGLCISEDMLLTRCLNCNGEFEGPLAAHQVVDDLPCHRVLEIPGRDYYRCTGLCHSASWYGSQFAFHVRKLKREGAGLNNLG